MSEPFDPADPAAWIAHGRNQEHAAALADAWRRFPDLPGDFPADARMARMRERVTALRPVMESMARVVEEERQARNFAFTVRWVAEEEGDDRDRAILRARDIHGHDWDRAVRYAAGWYTAHAGWEPECRRPGPHDAGAEAYDQGFRDGGGNRDDVFDTARRALNAARTLPSSTNLSARPLPSTWLKPTDAPRPTRWKRRLLLLGAPEAGLVGAQIETALLRPALDACPGSEEATVIVISGSGFHPLAGAGAAAPFAGPDALARLASDRTHQDRLRALLGERDFDDILVAAQGDYLTLLDAHAAALPLCRTMERTRNSALQQRAHLQEIERRGEVTPSAIASALQFGQATITNIVDRLVANNLVTRQRSERDRRYMLLRITEAGRTMLETAPDLLQNRFQDRFGTLPAWEQAMILAALERLGELLDATDIDAAPLLDGGVIDRSIDHVK